MGTFVSGILLSFPFKVIRKRLCIVICRKARQITDLKHEKNALLFDFDPPHLYN